MLKIIEYNDHYFEKWNKFITESNNGTIFHRLDFLEYHGNKFRRNENHLIWLKGEALFALMPMAIFYENGKKIAKSPYGASYGGIITTQALNYNKSHDIVSELIKYCKRESIDNIFITLPLRILEKVSSDTLLFSLLENGFCIANSDISSVLFLSENDLEHKIFTSRARNMARKARKVNVHASLNANIDDFWKVMEKTFNKHCTRPTHTFDEWKYLNEKFPDSFWNDVAYIDNRPIAGIGHVKINDYTDSSFYLCNDPEYYETQALTLLIYETLLNSQDNNFKYFDFGTSSMNMKARENIFRFKESFGAIGIFRKTIFKEII